MRKLWISLVLVSTVATGCKRTDTPTTPTPTDTVFYTALAASDGIGIGGSVPCVPFDPDCPAGTGYVYLLKRRIQSAGRTVTLLNLSVPGAVLSPGIQTLLRDLGQDAPPSLFDQSSAVFPATTHMTIFTGGNDANAIGQNVRAGRGGSDIRGFIDRHVNQFGVDVGELVRRIRTRAPNARIVALNVPNLGIAPYVADLTVQERSIVQRIAVGLSDRINSLTSQNVLVVDLMCESRIYEGASFSADGFHPSDRGYSVIADITYPVLANATASAPSSSCPQRTALPIF